jgi:hypothetical protein
MALIWLSWDFVWVFSCFLFDFGVHLFRAPWWRPLNSDIVILGGGTAEFVLFDLDHFLFAIKLLHDVLLSHSVDFILLLFVTDVHWFVFGVAFREVLDISGGLSIDRVQWAFRILFGFSGMKSGLILHFHSSRDLLFFVWYTNFIFLYLSNKVSYSVKT